MSFLWLAIEHGGKSVVSGGEAPHPNNTTNGAIPRRLIYSPNEASQNAENYQAVLQAQGPDNQVTRVWWDVN